MFKRSLFRVLILSCVLAFSACGGNTPAITTDQPITTDPPTEPVIVTEPPKPEILPVFLDVKNGNDENDGTTPENAVATFDKAFSLLREERSLVVVMNTVVTDKQFIMPEYDGLVTITSVYDDVDFRKENGASLNVAALVLSGDVHFENITLMPQEKGAYISCRFNDLSIGEGVNVSSDGGNLISIIGGYYVTDLALNQENTMKAEDVSYKGDCRISVMSGTWDFFMGGNYRAGINSAVGTFNGNMTVDIGGTAEFLSADHANDVISDVVTAGGENIHKGSVTLNISGGRFACPVYGISKLGTYMNAVAANDKTGTSGLIFGDDVRYEADITINISGGVFTAENCAYIGALQVAGDTAVHGDFKLSVSGGDFGDNMTFSALGMIGNSVAEGIPNDKEAKCFNKVNGKESDDAAPLRIACIGDSITFGTCAWFEELDGYLFSDEYFYYPAVLQRLYGYDAVVGNFGFPGSNISLSSYSKYYQSCSYNRMTAFDPDIVVIALGTNNAPFIAANGPDFKNAYRTMIEDIHTRFPEAKLIMTTALYRWDDWGNQLYVEGYVIPYQKDLANEYDYVTLYDTFTEFKPYATDEFYHDRLHPNNAGYAKLAEIMKKGIDPLIGK